LLFITTTCPGRLSEPSLGIYTRFTY